MRRYSREHHVMGLVPSAAKKALLPVDFEGSALCLQTTLYWLAADENTVSGDQHPRCANLAR